MRKGNRLIVNARDPEEIRVALVEGNELCELRVGQASAGSLVGNIYLARVKQIEPGLDAAFLEFGDRRAGFLHVGNIHPGYADPQATVAEVASSPLSAPTSARADDDAEVEVEDSSAANADDENPQIAAAVATVLPAARVEQLLQPERLVLVQVLRDPVRGKGATLTTFLSLAGYSLVLMPSLGRIGVSRRVGEAEERDRLRALLEELGAGPELPVIARTVAAGQSRRALRADLELLQEKWRTLLGHAHKQTAPCLVYQEEATPLRAARELFHGGIEEIVCDSEEVELALRTFLDSKGAGEHVRLTRHDSRRPLFEALDLERSYQRLFAARVPIGGGASIVIHETEALTAIDVNSGRVDRDTLEMTALETNLSAAEEILRQVRLRDLGGILVVDFIDMREPEHRRQVEHTLRDGLRRDRARMKCGRLGSFGLMTFTRRRLGTGPAKASEAMCRGCGGSGNVVHHRAGAMMVLRRLRSLEGPSRVHLRAQPGTLQEVRHHRSAIEALGHQLETSEDFQVPASDPVLEVRGSLATSPPPR